MNQSSGAGLRIVLTGGTGFVGRHLGPTLAGHGATVASLGGATAPGLDGGTPCIDINDMPALSSFIHAFQPDAVVHLAAVSSVAESWRHPEATMQVNVMGSLSLLAAMREAAPEALLVSLGSAEEYGGASGAPRREGDATVPANPYGVSKLAQGLLVQQLARQYHLRACHVRAFNLIGPGQSPTFVAADWAAQIAAIEAGRRTATMTTGNLDISRDFLDVRDGCDAIASLLASPNAHGTYNLCSGSATSLRDLLDGLLALTPQPIEVRVDSRRFRPAETPALVGDATRLAAATGWRPSRSLAETLGDVLEYWRGQFRGSS